MRNSKEGKRSRPLTFNFSARWPGLAITQLVKQERDCLDNPLEKWKVGSTTIWQVGKGDWVKRDY